MIDDVATHVAEGASAEIPPAAPAERGVGRIIRTLVNRPEPQIPVERRRDGRRLRRTGDALLPQFAGAIGPDMDFADVADDAGLNPFVGQPRAFGGVPLIAHRRHHTCGLGGFGQFAAFEQRVRQRLLAIDVLARLDRGHRRNGVNVIGRADRHGVNVAWPPCRASRENPCSVRLWDEH